MSNASNVFTRVGTKDDLSTDDTLFGRLAKISGQVAGVSPATDVSSILTTVTSIKTAIGSSTDASTSSTVFGERKSVQSVIGIATDSTSAATLFGHVRNVFFSSRGRHARLQGDWSSDVCSSDLRLGQFGRARLCRAAAGSDAFPHGSTESRPTEIEAHASPFSSVGNGGGFVDGIASRGSST